MTVNGRQQRLRGAATRDLTAQARTKSLVEDTNGGVVQARFPAATRLTITEDDGGTNGHQVRLRKVELAERAAETDLTTTVSVTTPPGLRNGIGSSTAHSRSSP